MTLIHFAELVLHKSSANDLAGVLPVHCQGLLWEDHAAPAI